MSKRTKADRRRAALKGWRRRRAMFKAFGALLGKSGFTKVSENKRTGLVVARVVDGPFTPPPTGYVMRYQFGLSRL